MDNHKSVLNSFGIDQNDDELDLPYIHLIPKMQRIPKTSIHCRFSQMLRQASIHSPYTAAYTY